MPARYSGATDFDEYLVQFEIIAEMHGWSAEEKASVLMAKLDGPALAVAAPVATQGYQALSTKLKARFSPDQQEAYSLRLRTRSQTKGETYEALADDVEKLAKKAYPQAEEPTRCRLATDAFVNAIADDKIREKLRDRAPKTIEEALKAARQLAASRELEKQRVNLRAVQDKEERPTESEEVRQLREELRQVKADLQELRSPAGTAAKGDYKKPGRYRQPRTVVCFQCNEPGHIRKWCPQKYYHPVTVAANQQGVQQTTPVQMGTGAAIVTPPPVAPPPVQEKPALNSQGQNAAGPAP